MAALTAEQARAFQNRWALVRKAEALELQGTPISLKLRQLSALMASRHLFSSAVREDSAAERVAAPLLAALTDLAHWFADIGVRAMIIGGPAASLLGRPRLTRDIDAMAFAPESQWPHVLRRASTHGILPRPEMLTEFDQLLQQVQRE